MRFLVIQHIACEPPAAYEDEMIARGIDFERVEVDETGELPDWRPFDAIIAMGGPMSANDDAALPWLSEEKRLISDAVRAGTPYWGVCLGAQLLASSLGARVYPNPQAEVGIYGDLELTDAAARDPVFAHTPSGLTALQWHEDTFDLPDGAHLLVTSKQCRHQAFAWGPAYAIQFHLEVPAELAASWADVPTYASALERVLGAGALPRLVDALRDLENARRVARELFGRWIDVVVVPRGTATARSTMNTPPRRLPGGAHSPG